MRKILFLCFSVLCANFVVAQQSVTITGPTSVEVGVPNNYTFRFNPLYVTNSQTGVTPDSYLITEWVVITGSSCSNGQVIGYIGNSTNQTCYYNNSTYNSSNPLTIPIQWGDGTFLRDDNIQVKVSGIYRKSSTGENTGYFSYLTNDLAVTTVNRIVSPIIVGNTSVLNCDQTTAVYSVSNTTYADSFLWQVTNGAQITGSAAGTSVSVKPPITGSFDVICTAKRSGSNSNYFRASSNTITRNSRTINYALIDTKNWLGIGAGRDLSIENQSGVATINWVAPGCTVVGQGTINATITPTTSVPEGSIIDVYAAVTYTGGCTASTPINSYTVFGASNPPVPNGYMVSTPDDGNVCTATSFFLDFVGQNNSYWQMTVSPRVVFASTVKATTRNVQVCFSNPFTGVKNCQSYGVLVPAPCVDQTTARLSSHDGKFFPNPTQGNFTISLGKEVSGNYEIYDSVGFLVQKQNFKKQSILEIELVSKLNNGYYYVHLNTDDTNLNTKQTLVLQR
jgi:hypothetical protein